MTPTQDQAPRVGRALKFIAGACPPRPGNSEKLIRLGGTTTPKLFATHGSQFGESGLGYEFTYAAVPCGCLEQAEKVVGESRADMIGAAQDRRGPNADAIGS